MRNHPSYTALEEVRNRLGRYEYYRALFVNGINPDEIWSASARHEEPADLMERVQIFLDVYRR